MTNNTKKRFDELYNRSYMQGYCTFTSFLNMDEQSELNSLNLPYTAYGGYDGCERIVAGFGDIYDVSAFDIVCLEISPASKRFAEGLCHRDVLGALMNLGIKREMLGDIILKDNTAYAFCLGQISGYIIDNLTRIKHTTVSAKSIPSLPDNARVQPTEQEFFVPSLRLDALVSKAYRLSRSETSKLFEQGKVFVNSRLVQSTSYTLKENDIVSVRGFGRLVFNAVVRTTKKDRLVISVLIYR